MLLSNPPYTSMTHLPFFPPLLLLLLILLRSGGAAAQNLIKDTCKTCAKDDPNIQYAFCTTSLQAGPAREVATLRGLGKVSLRLVGKNVTDNKSYIQQLMKNKKLDPYFLECLSDCFQLYSDAIPSMDQAAKDYDSEQYLDANLEISSVMDAATTCEGGFKEKKGVVSPLTRRNNNVFQLSALALSIMRMIQT